MSSANSSYSPTAAVVNYTIELDDVRLSQAGGFPSSIIKQGAATTISLEVNTIGPSALFVNTVAPITTVTIILEALGHPNDFTVAAPAAALNANNVTFTANVAAGGLALGLYKVMASIAVGAGAGSFGVGFVESGVIEVVL
jgi:hypothetical protein